MPLIASRGGARVSQVPGLRARAEALGFRIAASASGTTANVLQMAWLLGFSAEERVVLRATMAAWMVPTDDHSLMEVLLGADSFVPERFRTTFGMRDLERLWPPEETIRVSSGEAFDGASVWRSVAQRLGTSEGQRLLSLMSPEARAFVQQLTAAPGNRVEL